MTKFVTPASIPAEVWAVLRAIGLPEDCTAATIRLRGNDPIEIECTFLGKCLENDGAALAELIETYRLVPSNPN